MKIVMSVFQGMHTDPKQICIHPILSYSLLLVDRLLMTRIARAIGEENAQPCYTGFALGDLVVSGVFAF